MPREKLRQAAQAPKQAYDGTKSFVGERRDKGVGYWLSRLTIKAPVNAVAGDTASDQMEGALVMILWSIMTGVFTGLVTVVFVGFWSIFLMIGVARNSDLGDSVWGRVTSGPSKVADRTRSVSKIGRDD